MPNQILENNQLNFLSLFLSKYRKKVQSLHTDVLMRSLFDQFVIEQVFDFPSFKFIHKISLDISL